MSHGGWEVKVSTNFPQKVATAIGKLTEELFGAEYEVIAYLGSQVVNGINHAVLAEQTIINGKDTKNAVVIVFNEKPNSMDLSLVSINTLIRGSSGLGGIKVDMTANADEVPEEAKAAFESAFEGFVGSKVDPFAYIGQQVTKGIDYIFACEVSPVVQNPVSSLALVTIHSMDNSIEFKNFFSDKENTNLGYSFTW